MTRFTVLGATGYVGSRLAVYLRSQGFEVLTPARHDPVIFNQPLGHLMYCIGLTGNFRTRPFDTVQAHVEVLSSVLKRADFESLTYLSSIKTWIE